MLTNKRRRCPTKYIKTICNKRQIKRAKTKRKKESAKANAMQMRKFYYIFMKPCEPYGLPNIFTQSYHEWIDLMKH